MSEETSNKVLFVAQEVFFVKLQMRPVGLSEKDIFSFAQMQLESFSPLPIEVLRWGYCVSEKQIMIFAASADRLSRMKSVSKNFDCAEYVFPFMALLWKQKLEDGWSIFKCSLNDGSFDYLAVKVENGIWLKVFAVSLDSESSDANAIEKLSILASEKILTDISNVEFLGVKFSKIFFKINSKGKETKCFASGRKFLLNADIRDKFVLSKIRRKIFYDKFLNYFLLAGICLFVICLLWRMSFFYQNSKFEDAQEALNTIKPEADKVMAMSADANFLTDINSKKMHNTLTLAKVNNLRPDGISFIKTISSGTKKLEIRGKAQSLTLLNKFEENLKAQSFVKSVQKKITQNQSEGALWTINLELKD